VIKEAINRVLDLASVQLLEVGGCTFSSRPVNKITPDTIEPVHVHTLQAVKDFFAGDIGKNADIAPDSVVIHVVDPYRVMVLSGHADESYRQRECYLVAERIHDEFPFGKWFQQEEAVININLMTMFEQTDTLKEVIRVVSGLISSTDVRVDDDGVSQEVSVRKGIQRVENVTIENPIMLSPIRTFTEVEQVESPYVLRVRCKNEIPEVAIFEAGGGQWKNDAIARIRFWLADEIGQGVKILG
jgi:hypothetical protein